ncbi:MAG: hypothetical protein ACJ8AO_00355 [Gemmatimonadaceae bacterium]
MRLTRLALPLAALLAAGCASGGGSADTPPATAQPGAAQTPGQAAQPATAWPVQTREHVDLWLHGYAMLYADSTRVPYFRRGYRDAMVTAKNRANVVTQLDANRERLSQRLAASPPLFNTQFVAFYFDSWDELRQAIDWFIRAEGDPRRASNVETQRMLVFLAQNFPTAADRDWLRLFSQSLEDERAKFYHNYWVQAQGSRGGIVGAVDELWQRTRPKLQRFLANTQQEGGRILLSLPLGGEGRTINSGSRQNTVAVTYPETAADAAEAVYVFVHEVALNVAATAVRDNITPAEARSGLGDRYTSAASVRAGYLVLAKAAPELAEGYARYYLRAAGVTPGADVRAQLNSTFVLPQAIREALERQIDVVLGGI